jgi:hypothetical protein
MICALVATAFQVATEAQAVPAAVATAPWLDGRPAVIYVAEAPSWRPGSDEPIHLVRFVAPETGSEAQCGVLDGDNVLVVSGGFSAPTPTGRVLRRSDVRLLSPLREDQISPVMLLEPSQDSRFAAVGLDLVPGSPWGPLDSFEVRPGTSCIVRQVLALVVGPSSTLFGVTGATLVREDGQQAWRLALGPSLVRGSRLGTSHRVPALGVSAAEALMAEVQYKDGGLLLLDPIGTGDAVKAESKEWITRTPGVGELRNVV